MLKFRLPLFSLLLLMLTACKPAVTPTALYGKWKYTKLESQKDDATASEWKIKTQEPTIEFTKGDSLIMMWGGNIFAKGKFKTDGNKILFNQDLEDGRKYEYKFVVDELSAKQIVFETTGNDPSKVTAVK